MLIEAPDVGFDQHHPGYVIHVADCKSAHVVAAKRIADQNIRSFDSGVVKRAVEFVSDAHAGARHRAGIAETRPGAIVAAGTRPLRDPRLYDRPDGSPVLPTGIEDHGGRTASHAVDIQACSL